MGRSKSKSPQRNPAHKNETPTVAASSSAPPPPPPWIELPADITANIVHRLGAIEILQNAQKVCTTWRRACLDPAMWKVIDMKNAGDLDYEEFDMLCHQAVDRSQGQLVDLSIDYSASAGLLDYIVDRSSHLRRLQLYSCEDRLTAEGFAEALKKLPHLEELHLIVMSWFLPTDIETIGTSCLMLKSFTFNEPGSEEPIPEEHDWTDNEYALAIARTMPNLRHLRLFANCMDNEGLWAILDGCPHLESLDLRQCFNLDLGGEVGRRCVEQVKYLKCPSDSIADVWWLADEPPVDWDDSSACGYRFGPFGNLGCYDDFECCEDYTSGFDYDESGLWGDDDF